MPESELQLTLPARAENVIVVRQALSGIGEAVGLPEQRIDDMKTVITEACNNVVLHAYDGEPGPLEVAAGATDSYVEVTVADRGRGFQPKAAEAEQSLGLGLPLIASLSDSFEISGGAGDGTRTTIRFATEGRGAAADGAGDIAQTSDELELAIVPGAMVRPVLARVIGALAARAAFPIDRLSDTVLLGDAVSAHREDDFSGGRVGIAIREGEGSLEVRVGPLVEGGGQRILEQMDLPGGEGSLRGLAKRMEVVAGEAPGGGAAEWLVIEVAP